MLELRTKKHLMDGSAKTKVKKKKPYSKYFRENLEYILMVAPGFILTFIFSYIPMFGIIVAFKNIDYKKGIFGSPWNGFENFKFLFQFPDVKIIVRNTIGYNLVFIVLGIVVPVTFAIILSQIRNKLASKFYQTVMFLPYFLSWIIVSYIVYAFLAYDLGLVNKVILAPLGIDPVDWYGKPEYWPFIIILLHTWKTAGYSTVVYLAAITGIDHELYEAASIDGATKRQQTFCITIPSISTIIIIMLILAIGKILSADFGLFFNVPLEQGRLLPVTNVIDTFVFKALRINGDIAMSSAAGLLKSVIGFFLVMVTNKIVKRYDESKALY